MVATRDEVVRAVLALNGPERPFAYEATPGGVVARWHYADARWAGVLEAASVSRSYTLTVTLHDDATFSLHDVTDDREARVRPRRSGYRRDVFSGTVHRKSFSWTSAPVAVDRGRVGHTAGWSFSTEEVKAPVRTLLEQHGWRRRDRNLLDRLLGR